MIKKIFLISILLFISSFYFTDNARADEASCTNAGGYCYDGNASSTGNCPVNEEQIDTCDFTNQIYCCKESSGSGNKIVPDELAGLPTNPDLVYGIVENVADWLLSLIGILAVIGLVVSGIQYYFVATDEKMMETAKKTMMASIIGLVVALSGYIVIETIDTILNAGM